MQSIPDLELTIARAANGAITASLRVDQRNHRADLVEDVPVKLNDKALRALSLIPDAYAGALTGMVFVPALREAWQRAIGYAEGAGKQMRVRLHLRGNDVLHALRWELLRDPITNTPLAYRETVSFSRYLSSDHLGDIQAASKPRLRAVVAVSAAAGPGMTAVDVAGEVQRALTGLSDIQSTILDGREGRPTATLAALADALRSEIHILYLVCHGALVQRKPMLYLERQAGEPDRPIRGEDIVRQIADLTRRPLLIVLASCRGAGDNYQTLAAVGPQLARKGVGAVIAMQGDVPMELIAQLTPRLFTELSRDGQIDRALAAARAALPNAQPWWLPTLWMAVKDGALWRTPEVTIRGIGVSQVPYRQNPLFRGRDAELKQMAEILLGEVSGTAAAQLALAGTGGLGKTQLASEFAHRHCDDFPGGVFWLNMAQPELVAAQVVAAGEPSCLNLPGWQGLDFEEKVKAVRRAWDEPVCRLLVFDNLQDPQLLKKWGPIRGGSRVLITTQRGIWTATSGVQVMRLTTLPRPESMRLLLAPRHGSQVESILAEQNEVDEANAICTQVGDLPLALALAGAYLQLTPSLSLAGYRQRLAELLLADPSLEATLDEELPTAHASSVAVTIALSYQQLAPTKPTDVLALTLLQRMAHLASAPIPQRLLVRLAERNPDDERQATEVDALLRRLETVGLIELLPKGGATVHQLVAAFVRGQDRNPERSIVTAGEAYIDEIMAINDSSSSLEGVPYLAHQSILISVEQQITPETLATFLNELGYLLDSMGDYRAAKPYYERALDIREQVLGPEHPQTADSLNNLGYLLYRQGDYTSARPYYDRALAVREKVLVLNHPDTAQICNNLGLLLTEQGEYAAARSYCERTLAISEQASEPIIPDTATYLSNLGSLLHIQGDYLAARPYYERALAFCEQYLTPDHSFAAQSCNNLGALLTDLGEYAAARLYLDRALTICEQKLGPTHDRTAKVIEKLGRLLRAQGDVAGARSYYERAHAIFLDRLGVNHRDTQDAQKVLAEIDIILNRGGL